MINLRELISEFIENYKNEVKSTSYITGQTIYQGTTYFKDQYGNTAPFVEVLHKTEDGRVIHYVTGKESHENIYKNFLNENN